MLSFIKSLSQVHAIKSYKGLRNKHKLNLVCGELHEPRTEMKVSTLIE